MVAPRSRPAASFKIASNCLSVSQRVPSVHNSNGPCRRVGRLPEKAESDAVDFTPLLHRDGSVFSVVYPSDLEQPE